MAQFSVELQGSRQVYRVASVRPRTPKEGLLYGIMLLCQIAICMRKQFLQLKPMGRCTAANSLD